MVSTYLESKVVLDSLLANSQFLSLAKVIVNSNRGSASYLTAYSNLNTLLTFLGVNQRVNIIKSDGGFWYSNLNTPEQSAAVENHNTRPEVFSAVNYAFGNPICNKKLYALDLQSSVCSGYGFAERVSSTEQRDSEQYVAKTYKPSATPLNRNVFTLRVSQVA